MVSIKHPDLWTAYKEASQLSVNSQEPSKMETQGKDPLSVQTFYPHNQQRV